MVKSGESSKAKASLEAMFELSALPESAAGRGDSGKIADSPKAEEGEVKTKQLGESDKKPLATGNTGTQTDSDKRGKEARDRTDGSERKDDGGDKKVVSIPGGKGGKKANEEQLDKTKDLGEEKKPTVIRTKLPADTKDTGTELKALHDTEKLEGKVEVKAGGSRTIKFEDESHEEDQRSDTPVEIEERWDGKYRDARNNLISPERPTRSELSRYKSYIDKIKEDVPELADIQQPTPVELDREPLAIDPVSYDLMKPLEVTLAFGWRDGPPVKSRSEMVPKPVVGKGKGVAGATNDQMVEKTYYAIPLNMGRGRVMRTEFKPGDGKRPWGMIPDIDGNVNQRVEYDFARQQWTTPGDLILHNTFVMSELGMELNKKVKEVAKNVKDSENTAAKISTLRNHAMDIGRKYLQGGCTYEQMRDELNVKIEAMDQIDYDKKVRRKQTWRTCLFGWLGATAILAGAGISAAVAIHNARNPKAPK